MSISTITVYSKNFQALEIIRVKKFIPNAVYEINVHQVMIFKFDAAYKKHQMIEIGNESREKIQVLSQVLE